MSGLFHSLNIGSESLYANRQGIDTTAHNIANAQTEGYSRQRIELNQRDPLQQNEVLIGNGVYVDSIKRSHDKFIERQLNNVKSSFQESEARSDAISELEAIFDPDLAASVSSELDAFFASLSTLSNFPEELTARTSVRENAINLVSAFKRVDFDIRRVRDNLNEKLLGSIEEVNDILLNISKLNEKISGMEAGAASLANDLHDQRDRLLQRLSELVKVHYYEDKQGMLTIRGPGDMLMVEGRRPSKFEIRRDAANEGMYEIIGLDSEGGSPQNITHLIGGGALKGILEARDKTAKHLLDQNNEMAAVFIDNFNQIHRQGFGLNEFQSINGIDFFEPVGERALAARDMRISDIILNSTDAISAASTSGSPGDNINLNRLISLKNERIFPDGQANLVEFYSNYVGVLGIEALRADHILESDKVLHTEWSTRRESIAGVSLDEEATNLIRWQTAFTASSKVITTIDEMLETILTLKR